MELTAGRVLVAFIALTTILNEKRVLPMIGAFRMARLHAALGKDAVLISEKRSELIKELAGTTEPNDGEQWAVPKEKMKEFNQRWKELAEEKLEVACFPVALGVLGLAPSITASEFLDLGELIKDPAADDCGSQAPNLKLVEKQA